MKVIDNSIIESLNKTRYYNAEDGTFRYKADYRRFKKDDIAGYKSNRGYVTLKIGNVLYYAHRLVWFIEYGFNPEYIDHINRIKSDNRICNLRDVSPTENSQNRSVQNRNSSGVTGVSYKKSNKKWYASIWIDGKFKHLGCSENKSEAINMRLIAEEKYGFIGECL